ncbi:unnamed protein product [Rodentolepis nana]|uniref:Granulin n=1 Tax=Rodentolepis nana TaxID=102285 RepID=A0A0R3TWZ1_RODNA|nr:unnamed protein product [Rodentolepis nana]
MSIIDIKCCLQELADKLICSFLEQLEACTEKIQCQGNINRYDPITYSECRDCIIKLAQKLRPDLAMGMETCGDNIQCPDDRINPCLHLHTKPDCSESIKCEMKIHLLKLAKSFNSVLEKYLESCEEETPCSESCYDPDPNQCGTTSCFQYCDCTTNSAQNLCPEVALCGRTCADTIPCCNDQINSCPHPPANTQCSEDIECEIRMSLHKLAETLINTFLDNLQTCTEEIRCQGYNTVPDFCDCNTNMAQNCCPELPMCTGACADIIPCSNDHIKPCAHSNSKHECFENVDLELLVYLLRLGQNLNSILEQCVESCEEETPCSGNHYNPDPNYCGTTSCSQYCDCTTNSAQNLCPKEALCAETCADTIPCCYDQINTCQQSPTNPNCSENIECELKMSLHKLAETWISSLMDHLQAYIEETRCSVDQNEINPCCYNPTSCSDYLPCIIELAQQLSPQLTECKETCANEIQCSYDCTNSCPNSPTKPDCLENNVCEIIIYLLKLAQSFSSFLEKYLELCEEEASCSENYYRPEPNHCGTTSCSQYCDCIINLAQNLCSEEAPCMGTCNNTSPCCNDQINSCPHPPASTQCSEDIECEIKLTLHKLAATLIAILIDNLQTCTEETQCQECCTDPDPDFCHCITKLAQNLCPELAGCMETTDTGIACQNDQIELCPTIPNLTDEAYCVLIESLLNMILILHPEINPCCESVPVENPCC